MALNVLQSLILAIPLVWGDGRWVNIFCQKDTGSCHFIASSREPLGDPLETPTPHFYSLKAVMGSRVKF